MKPATIQEYNRYIAYMDKSDYMTNTCSFSRETLKWTKKLFMQILGLILWTDLPNSPSVFQYYHTNISDLYWSGTLHKKGNECLYLRWLHTDTVNWPDFMDNIANSGHWKEKLWNMGKVKKSRTQYEVVCQSMCTPNSYLKAVWHYTGRSITQTLLILLLPLLN